MTTRQEAVEIFRNGPATVQKVLDGVTENEEGYVPAPGKWTIRQIVRHVADTEIVVGMRLRQIIAEESPTLIPFDQEAWAANLGYESAAVSDSFARFRSVREDTAKLLESLPDQAFDRPGVHPERGTKSLLEWVHIFGVHVERHADQIRAIREKARG